MEVIYILSHNRFVKEKQLNLTINNFINFVEAINFTLINSNLLQFTKEQNLSHIFHPSITIMYLKFVFKHKAYHIY
jgi:hypothetical protein